MQKFVADGLFLVPFVCDGCIGCELVDKHNIVRLRHSQSMPCRDASVRVGQGRVSGSERERDKDREIGRGAQSERRREEDSWKR